MKQLAIRKLIPWAHRDLSKWVEPTLPLKASTRREYVLRRRAVVAYARNMSFSDIKFETGMGRSYVKRLVNRCLLPHPDGQIEGFRGLLPGRRIKGAIYGVTSEQHRKGSRLDSPGGLDSFIRHVAEMPPRMQGRGGRRESLAGQGLHPLDGVKVCVSELNGCTVAGLSQDWRLCALVEEASCAILGFSFLQCCAAGRKS